MPEPTLLQPDLSPHAAAGQGVLAPVYALDVLGPVQLRRAGAHLTLPTQKSQALMLLLALGGAAHRARLAGWLWPQADERSARRNLRRELARLREAGAGDALCS